MCKLHLQRAANEMSCTQNKILYKIRTITEFGINMQLLILQKYSPPLFPFSRRSHKPLNYKPLIPIPHQLLSFSFPFRKEFCNGPCFNPLLVLLPLVNLYTKFTFNMPQHRGIKLSHYIPSKESTYEDQFKKIVNVNNYNSKVFFCVYAIIHIWTSVYIQI